MKQVAKRRAVKSFIWGELSLSEGGEHLREINEENDLFHPLFCVVPISSTIVFDVCPVSSVRDQKCT